MKWLLAAVLLALAAATPQIRYFHYQRAITLTAAAQQASTAQTCTALDAGVFAHAAPGLTDLRLYRGAGEDATETPYVVRQSMPAEPQERQIAPLDLGKRGSTTTFAAKMPVGHYGDVDLDIAAKNFIATVAVTGSQTETGSEGTELGIFTIFDLTGQKLGRSTVLHLPESDFRYLYFGITGPVKPTDVQGLSVERIATQQQFVVAATAGEIVEKNHETQATFTVPAHVPVDRVDFVAGPEPENFSRDVTVTVKPIADKESSEGELPASVSSSGTLLRVHGVHDGRQIDEEQLGIEAPYMDFSTASRWTVTIDNGDDAPLDLQAAHLEMAERQLCFDRAAGASYTLFYGDAALSAPRYDYATLFTPDKNAAQATLGPEQANPQYTPRPDSRPLTERYPWLLWVALVLVVALLGGIALRTAKETAPPR